MEKRYQAALKQQGFTDDEVRQGIKLQLIREDVFNKVTKDTKVSDDEIKTYYDKNKQQYATPAQPPSRDVRHILVKTRRSPTSSTRSCRRTRASSPRSRRSTRPTPPRPRTAAGSRRARRSRAAW